MQAHFPRHGASSAPVTLHLVDDDPGVRAALGAVLADLPCQLRCHGSAEEFLEAYSPVRAECLVLDVGLPGMSGLELLTRLTRSAATLPTLVLSANTDVERVVSAIQRGALDFLEKPPAPHKLVARVSSLLQMASEAAEARRSLQQLRTAQLRLTDREREVFALLARGLSAKQVAHELGLSIRTAHIHRTNVMLKFGVETTLQIVQVAARLNAVQQSASA